MAKSSGLAGIGSLRPEWHRTPWWAFWRPAWRRDKPTYWNTTHSWEYQTHKKRARAILEERFDDSSPTTQQAPHNLTATAIAHRLSSKI